MEQEKLRQFKTGPGTGVKVDREAIKNTDLSKHIDETLKKISLETCPGGLTPQGYAVVFLYDKIDGLGNMRAHFICKATFRDGVPEQMADAGIKELSRHCMQLFGRMPKKERK